MLLTPIMWCFLGSGGTLNILHQYSVSIVFGTVNCGQNKTHDQADITDILGRTWRKCPISDIKERYSLKLHLRPQLWEVSIILKYRIYNIPAQENSETDFFLNNQPDALIIPILFCYKTLHVSGIFSARHQEFSTVHSALVSFMQFSDDRFQAESGWNWVPSWLCLEAVIRNLYEAYQCRMYSRKLLMMGRVDARNM